MVFEKDGVFEKDEVFENGQSVLISRLTECFSFMCVCNGQEGGWFGGVATVDEVRRPHKVVALTVYWALPPSPRTVQGSHSPPLPCLTALSLSPNPRPFARSQPLTLLHFIYPHPLYCENGAEVTSQPEVS